MQPEVTQTFPGNYNGKPHIIWVICNRLMVATLCCVRPHFHYNTDMWHINEANSYCMALVYMDATKHSSCLNRVCMEMRTYNDEYYDDCVMRMTFKHHPSWGGGGGLMAACPWNPLHAVDLVFCWPGEGSNWHKEQEEDHRSVLYHSTQYYIPSRVINSM